MKNLKINKELTICNIILSMERPFAISQLLCRMEENGINDKDLVLDILGQLCESGIIKYSEIEDDVWLYTKRNLQFA